MMYIWSLVLLGAMAGTVELGLSEARSTTSTAQASAETLPSTTVKTSAGYLELSSMTPNVLAQQVSKGSVTSTVSIGVPSSVQTGPSASTGQGAESSTSDGFMLLGQSASNPTTTKSPAWSPSPTNVEVTASTSQPPHSTARTEPSTVSQSSPTSKPATVFQSSPTSKPATVFQSSPTSKPATVFQSSPTSKPATVFQSSPTSKPSTIFKSSPTSKPSTVSELSSHSRPSDIFDSSSTLSPSTAFDSSTRSQPASASVSLPPGPSHSTPQPAISGGFKSIWLLIVLLLIVAIVIIIAIICCLTRRKRRHSQTFAPQRRKKGKAEDAWAGPVAMPEDGGQAEGMEEKKDEDLASKRLSLPLSTFFGKRKSRAASMLIEEADPGNGKASAQQPLLSKQQNGQVADTQASGQRQGPATEPSPGDPSAQTPSDQELLLPPPPALQPNGHVQEPRHELDQMEQGPDDDLPPPSPLSETVLSIPEGQSGEGEKPDSLSVKTSL